MQIITNVNFELIEGLQLLSVGVVVLCCPTHLITISELGHFTHPLYYWSEF